MKVKVISRSDLEWSKDRAGEVPRAHRNFDPKFNAMAKQVEYTRAVRSAKLDRMFAKPFVAALGGHNDTIQCIALDPTNVANAVSGTTNGEAGIWDLMVRKPRRVWEAHRHSVDGVVVSPDGVAMFTASRDKSVKMWDLDISGDELQPSPIAEFLGEWPFSSIDHHQKTSTFVTSGHLVELWDVNRTLPIQKFTWGDDTITACKFNKIEGHLVACCMTDRGIFLYDTRSKSSHSKVILEMCCTSLSWNPMDPNVFVAGSDDWNCYLFDIRVVGRPRNVFQGHIHPVSSVDFAPTGKSFTAGSYDSTVRLWDVGQHTKSTSRDMFHTKRMAKVFSVAWSLDNNYILSGSEDAMLRVWKADPSKPIRPLVGAEKNTFNYMRSLRDKYAGFTEVRKIVAQRNTPKVIRKTLLRKKRIQVREAMKEMSVKKTDNLKPLSKRKVVQSLQ